MREFGFFGGLLLILVGVSLFGSTLELIQTPMNYGRAKQLQDGLRAGMNPEKQEQFDIENKKRWHKVRYRDNVNSVGYAIYFIGFLFSFFRSAWGPRLIAVGAPFKIWHGSIVGDPAFIVYGSIILVLALVLAIRWSKPIAV